MLDISLVILASGSSSRFGLASSKLFIRLGSTPLWLYCTNRLSSFYPFKKVVIACEDTEYFESFAPRYHYVCGGENRAKSLLNALGEINSEYVLVSDAARVMVGKDLVNKLIENYHNADCVTPVLRVSDSIIYDDEFKDRSKLRLIHTPQLSRTKMLKNALECSLDFTDDSAAIASKGGKIWYVEADENARKITYASDLFKLSLPALKQEYFIGTGFDVHAFGIKRPLILGGIKIHECKGLRAHSDGDVLSHALIDALLGAAGLGDIGEHFPDTDENYKNISSLKLLSKVYEKVLKYGFELVNADITVLMEEIKLKSFKKLIALKLGEILKTNRINIKASTTEKLGFVGRDEGVAVMASVSLKYFDWMKNENFDNRK